jgi:hypothetical protein
MSFFTELGKTITKFIWYHRKFQITKIILSKRNKARTIPLPYLKAYYKVVIKTALA